MPAIGADAVTAWAGCFGTATETRAASAAPAAALPTASTSTSSSTHICHLLHSNFFPCEPTLLRPNERNLL